MPLRLSIFDTELPVNKLAEKKGITCCCTAERKSRNREDQKHQREPRQNCIHYPLRWQLFCFLVRGNDRDQKSSLQFDESPSSTS